MALDVVTFEAGTEATAMELAPMLREQDLQEVWAVSHHSGEEALMGSLKCSAFSVAMRLDGEIAAMMGISYASEPSTFLGQRELGCIWFLTGRACDKHPMQVLAASRKVASSLHRASMCTELRNWVDARYVRARRFAEFIGFKVIYTGSYGVDGLDFHLVSRRM